MSRRRRMNLAKIQKLIAEGRGQGAGPDYLPWKTIQECMSGDQRNRILGWKTGRQHDYFRLLELYYHYTLDWSPIVIDIQEHFPLLSFNFKLPLEETILIAKQCGIRHPIDEESKGPIPLTTNFVITIQQSIGVKRLARTIIKASDLSKKRIIEMLEIERRFWLARGIDWGIITEHQIDIDLAKNIDWVHPYRSSSTLLPLNEITIHGISKTLTQMISECSEPLNEVALNCDDRLGLEAGSSLAVARHLIANRQWIVEMSQPIHPSKKLALLGTALEEAQLRRRSEG